MNQDNRRLTGLCLSFFVLFFAFFAASNQVAPTLGDLGKTSLAILYSAFAVSALITPSFLQCLANRSNNDNNKCDNNNDNKDNNNNDNHQQSNSLRAETTALILGSALYAPYLFACSLGTKDSARWIQLLSSGLLGIGAGFLWVAQGSLLTASCTTQNRGRWSGIFWASFMSGNAVGNFATAGALTKFPISSVFLGLSGVSLLSTLTLWIFVRPRTGNMEVSNMYARTTLLTGVGEENANANANENTMEADISSGLYEDIVKLWQALNTTSVQTLLPLILFIGCENSFWGGAFTDVVSTKHDSSNDVAMVSGVLASADIISSILTGMLLDIYRIDARLLLSVGLLSLIAGSILVWMEKNKLEMDVAMLNTSTPSSSSSSSSSTASSSSMWMIYVAGIGMGVGDGICNTVAIMRLQVLSVRYRLMSRRTAFQLFQCVNVAMTSITFVILSQYPATKSNVVWYVFECLAILSGLCLIGNRQAYTEED